MIDRYLRERLDKNTYRVFNAVLIFMAGWHFYCMFDESGIVGQLNALQAHYVLAGRYFPMLSFAFALLISMVPAAGLFLFYAHFKNSASGTR